MITDADVRLIALSMPGAQEKSHFRCPDFRVGNRIFVTLYPHEGRAVVKLSIADQSALVSMDPDLFSVNSWARPGWTNVRLRSIMKAHFRDVVRNAWRNVAPKKLVASQHTKGAARQPRKKS